MNQAKPFFIPKKLVMRAYQLVKDNKGAAGIDQQTLEDFDRNLKGNLYKLWNRLTSGSYFPPPVMALSIPKKSGGERILGIPTVSDRIAQMVVKLTFEPEVEPFFYPDSYGYRPNKSALDAIGVTRKRCWRYDWVVEFDIKGLFDNIDHDLLMKAVQKHTKNKWVILYIKRWLKAHIQGINGACEARTKGIPQGGVISPVLSNLFLHYVFDVWITKKYSHCPWCRYADDAVIHCNTQKEAQELLMELSRRFINCNLELHPLKTQVVYCQDANRRQDYPHRMFTFLGYDFRRRLVKSKTGELFLSFCPGASKEALNAIRAKIRKTRLSSRTEISLQDISHLYNPLLRGWIMYYGQYTPKALYPALRYFNMTLIRWASRKYKKMRGRKIKAGAFIQKISEENPALFEHWKRRMIAGFA